MIFTFAIILYYQRNLILDIINLIVVVTYCIIMNRNILDFIKKVFLSKVVKK